MQMALHGLLEHGIYIYLKDSREVSIHWSLRKLWCNTVVHLQNTK